MMFMTGVWGHGLCYTIEAREKKINHLKQVLSNSGYPKWAWNKLKSTSVEPHPSTNRTTPTKAHVTLPYVEGITEALSWKIQKAGVSAHTIPHVTIRSMLMAPKNKTHTLDKSDTVYNTVVHSVPITSMVKLNDH